jgi:formylglycine-generating enzyme required for sulfatase activity
MIELVRNHGGRPALLTYWMSLGAVNDALDAASQTTAAPLIDATLFHQPPWRAARMVAADLHPNALGYAAIARLTLRAIERQGWLPSPAAPTGQPAPNLPASEDLTAPSPPPSWVAIPAGEFTMGCSPGDGDCSSDELPPRRVRIAAFELNATEAQFAAVMGRNPSDFPDCAACPVDIVSWEDAAEYCQRTGGRLPSEAEWEYAARAGAATRYPCGDEAACLSAVAWSEANAGWRPHPVARKQHDAFGLYDMLGNVAEWTQDFHHHDYTGGPTDGAAWVSPAGQHRVMRGGAWTDGPRELRASARPWDIPYFGVDFGIGVRCARTPAAAGAVH